MADDVTWRRPEYVAALPIWQLVEDAAAGEAAVKARADIYLSLPNTDKCGDEARSRNAAYVRRARYYNVTGRTLHGLVGRAFAKWPEIVKPAGLDFLDEDADGAGFALINQSQATLAEVLKPGRAGLLVDYPATEAATTREEQAAGQKRATITLRCAADIVNWRTTKVGAKHMLSLVVLRESHLTAGAFETASEDQYRVLRLADGVYQTEIWREVETTTGKQWQMVEGPFQPKTGTGVSWTEIPFKFVGSVANTPDIGPSPLYDIATLNIGHFCNSADFEESAFLVGQPQPWISGVDEYWVKEVMGGVVYLGSRAVLPLPQGAAFGMEQAEPNSLAMEAMNSKEAQMLALGARLMEPGSAQKTATQDQNEESAAHSVLSLCCDNVSQAYTQALTWAAIFEHASGECSFAIDTDFSGLHVDGASLTAVVSAWKAGLPDADAVNVMRRLGLIDPERTDEEVMAEIKKAADKLPEKTLPAAA